MANVTKLIKIAPFYVGDITLNKSVTNAETTLEFSGAILPTGVSLSGYDGFILGIRKGKETERIYCPVANLNGARTSCTSVIRGLNPLNMDISTASTTYAYAHTQGAVINNVLAPQTFEMYRATLQGEIPNGTNLWRVGTNADDDIYYYANNADANKPYFKYDKATNTWVLSNNGVDELSMTTGGINTASTGLVIAAADIQIDTTDTDVFKTTTAGAGDVGKVAILNASGLINKANVDILKDVTSTAAELNKLAGTSANVTQANLDTLTGAGDTTLHTHTALTTVTNAGVTTRAAATASGTEVIAHGLAKTPKQIIFTSAGYGGTVCGFVDDDMNNFSVGFTNNAKTTSSTYCINATNASDSQIAAVTAWDATNFTLTWTKGGSGVETYVSWIALA